MMIKSSASCNQPVRPQADRHHGDRAVALGLASLCRKSGLHGIHFDSLRCAVRQARILRLFQARVNVRLATLQKFTLC